MPHKYTTEQREFICSNIRGRRLKDLTEDFNEHFGTDLSYSQIRAFTRNYGLRSGVDSRYKPGHTPANKGRKGEGGWKPTQFKKGRKPHNYMPVGSERVNGDGYIDIKTADPNKWRGKHILTWEEHNGAVPKGHVILFGDRNKRNFDISNLFCVSKRQLLILNRKKLIKEDTDLTRTGIIVAKLHETISKRKKCTSSEKEVVGHD